MTAILDLFSLAVSAYMSKTDRKKRPRSKDKLANQVQRRQVPKAGRGANTSGATVKKKKEKEKEKEKQSQKQKQKQKKKKKKKKEKEEKKKKQGPQHRKEQDAEESGND